MMIMEGGTYIKVSNTRYIDNTSFVNLAQEGVHAESGRGNDNRFRIHHANQNIKQIIAASANDNLLGLDFVILSNISS